MKSSGGTESLLVEKTRAKVDAITTTSNEAYTPVTHTAQVEHQAITTTSNEAYNSVTDNKYDYITTNEMAAQNIESNQMKPTGADSAADCSGTGNNYTGTQESAIATSRNEAYCVMTNRTERREYPSITTSSNEAYHVVTNYTERRESPAIVVSRNESHSVVNSSAAKGESSAFTVSSNEAYNITERI